MKLARKEGLESFSFLCQLFFSFLVSFFSQITKAAGLTATRNQAKMCYKWRTFLPTFLVPISTFHAASELPRTHAEGPTHSGVFSVLTKREPLHTRPLLLTFLILNIMATLHGKRCRSNAFFQWLHLCTVWWYKLCSQPPVGEHLGYFSLFPTIDAVTLSLGVAPFSL